MSRILGIDYGLTKIGIALGIGGLVQPLKTLPNTPNHRLENDALDQIAKIADIEGIGTVVIGIPYKNGKEAGHSKTIRKFAERLKEKLPENIKLEFVDESSTSKESLDIALDAGISQKKRKNDDAIAAGIIIKRWWEESS